MGYQLRVDAFAALSDPVRRELLRALASGPARVVDLAAAHTVSRPAVSRHLRLLTEAGLTTVEDLGRERHYALHPDGLVPVRELLDELGAKPRPAPPIAESAFDGLDLEVRRTTREPRTTTHSPSQEETA